MSLSPNSGVVLFIDICHWIYTAFGAMKNAKNKHGGCIVLCRGIKT